MHDLKRPTEAVPADQQDAPERSPVDFSDYGRARYMALDTRPVTEEARGLVQVIAARIEDWEQRSGARRYRRGRDTCEVFRQGVARFIGDLAIAADQDVRRWSFRLMSRGSFTGDEVSYRLFRAVFTALTELGMLDVLPGYYHREWAYGKATRLRATKELLELFEQHGVVRPHSDQHFQRGLPTRPLVLKARSTRMGHLKVSGRRINFVHTDHTHRLKSEVHDLNRFIASHDLEGGTHRGYRRIFNCGDDPDFDWNKGGRLYSLGEDSYQRLKKEERLRMLIDGEPVVEIDVRASFLTILYACDERNRTRSCNGPL